MTAELNDGEVIRLEGRAGYETPINRGWLTLTDRRLVWERRFSLDPFGHHELTIDLGKIRSCTSRGDAVVLDVDGEEVVLFVQWWLLSVLTDARRTKEWLREINRAMTDAGAGAAQDAPGDTG